MRPATGWSLGGLDARRPITEALPCHLLHGRALLPRGRSRRRGAMDDGSPARGWEGRARALDGAVPGATVPSSRSRPTPKPRCSSSALSRSCTAEAGFRQRAATVSSGLNSPALRGGLPRIGHPRLAPRQLDTMPCGGTPVRRLNAGEARHRNEPPIGAGERLCALPTVHPARADRIAPGKGARPKEASCVPCPEERGLPQRQ
jgi:hypothetical protein